MDTFWEGQHISRLGVFLFFKFTMFFLEFMTINCAVRENTCMNVFPWNCKQLLNSFKRSWSLLVHQCSAYLLVNQCKIACPPMHICLSARAYLLVHYCTHSHHCWKYTSVNSIVANPPADWEAADTANRFRFRFQNPDSHFWLYQQIKQVKQRIWSCVWTRKPWNPP